MKHSHTLGWLSFVASLGLAATTLLAILLATRSAAAYAGNRGPAFGAAQAHDQSEPLITAAGGFTSYLPIVYVTLPITFFDTFDNPLSGWPVHALNLEEPDPPGAWASWYGTEKIDDKTTVDNNVYDVKTVAAWNSWIYTAPVVLADPSNFTVQVDGKSSQAFMWASSWGLYFNANANRTKFYVVQIFQNSDGENWPTLMLRRYDNFVGSGTDENVILIERRCVSCERADFGWTQLHIERKGAQLYIYAGGVLLNVRSAPEYMSSECTGVGVFQGNFEWSDWNPKRYSEPAFQFDNFLAGPVYYRN